MALSAVQQQRLIVLEVKDAPDGRLAENIGALWDGEAAWAQLDIELQKLRVKRRCVELVRGYYADQFDFTAVGDAQVLLSKRLAFYDALRAQVQAELERWEHKVQRRRGGASLPITTTQPISVADELTRESQAPPLRPDPNDPLYAGSPFEPLNSNPNQFTP